MGLFDWFTNEYPDLDNDVVQGSATMLFGWGSAQIAFMVGVGAAGGPVAGLVYGGAALIGLIGGHFIGSEYDEDNPRVGVSSKSLPDGTKFSGNFSVQQDDGETYYVTKIRDITWAVNLEDEITKIIGNQTRNRVTGSEYNNIIDGKWGDDTLAGGSGRDNLTGGAGDDTFWFQWHDKVTDFEVGKDNVRTGTFDTNYLGIKMDADDILYLSYAADKTHDNVVMFKQLVRIPDKWQDDVAHYKFGHWENIDHVMEWVDNVLM